ncbi:MAG: C1 family peptidase [Candidatus Altiarchaeota archaeon]|nr:C1 family peptidase [Candidatus Altiarchaeota archaeon]
MKHISNLLLLTLSLVLFIPPVYAESVRPVGVANPAAVYCSGLGYAYRVVETDMGERGVCVFSDGVSECDAWGFLKGKCGKEYSYCVQKGYDIETDTVDKGGYFVEYAVCVSELTNSAYGLRIPLYELMEKNGVGLMDPGAGAKKSRRHSLSPYVGGENRMNQPKQILPSAFDWRNWSGHSYIGSIRNQGICGSCYAFAAAASAEGVYNVAKNLTGDDCSNLSESFIIWCLGRLPQYNTHLYSCDGADYEYMELAALTTQGICGEADFPYMMTDPGSCTHWNDPVTIFSSWHRIPCNDNEAIKTAIMTYGVVDAAVYAGDEFMAYTGGIYTDSLTDCPEEYYTDTNHAIALVGWGFNDTYGDYWILRNSWGTSWGEDGYMRIAATSARVACAATYLTPSSIDVNEIGCFNGSAWINCLDLTYGDTLEQVRVNCSSDSLNEAIKSVNFSLMNVPDNQVFFNGSGSFNAGLGYWVYDNPDIRLHDSGEWNLLVTCTGNESAKGKGSIFWSVPWGHLKSYLINPVSDGEVTQHKFFNYSSGIRCVGGECGSVNAILDPETSGNGCGCTVGGHDLPIMKPDPETLREWIEGYNKAQKISADPRVRERIKGSSGGFFSLISHLNYDPVERNQGSCSNCWAWAGTGAMEVALDVQGGVFDRLSVQYINSCEYSVIKNPCCEEGWLYYLADFYNITKKAVPWSNTNAGWQDGDGSCDTDCSAISTIPHYHISYIDELTIPTQGVDNASAIANIKSVLNQNKAVWFAFFLPTGAAWDDFHDFWNNYGEDIVYDMDQFCGIPGIAGGHVVLCVGYNDTDANNSYWIMLNSWGSTEGRPNGLFHMDMDIAYDCVNSFENESYYSFFWQTLNVSFDYLANKGVIPMDNGTPFYTIDLNPVYPSNLTCLQDMFDGDSCNQTWRVNATGEHLSGWTFYTIYEPATYPSYISSNQTEVIALTIDASSCITIVNPKNNTHLPSGTTWTWINISTDKNAVCRFNLTNPGFDYVSGGADFTNTGGLMHSFLYTGLSAGGTYHLYYKCNDSAGNINNESVHHIFFVHCLLVGDYPPCGEVILAEVMDYLILWSEGEAALADVVNLINAWAG